MKRSRLQPTMVGKYACSSMLRRCSSRRNLCMSRRLFVMSVSLRIILTSGKRRPITFISAFADGRRPAQTPSISSGASFSTTHRMEKEKGAALFPASSGGTSPWPLIQREFGRYLVTWAIPASSAACRLALKSRSAVACIDLRGNCMNTLSFEKASLFFIERFKNWRGRASSLIDRLAAVSFDGPG